MPISASVFSSARKDKEDEDIPRLEEGDEGSTHAQKIVRELYFRFEKQQQRWKDYRSLFFFLIFVGWFLAVLYLQRQSAVAYQVHHTLESVLVPDADSAQSSDAVYEWLERTMEQIWVDPVCGDGICDAPWEYASYSSFGCRADCGRLQEVQNLTAVQLDLYWDFSHPVGSLPASTLMQQASWNLCPVSTAYSSNCYFSDSTGTQNDKTFSQLSGTFTQAFLDVPDGDWKLVINRDIFNKVQGAVRSTVLLRAASYYYKVYIAARSAMAQQNFELELLTEAARVGGLPLFRYIEETLTRSKNATFAAFAVQQLVNATCGCDGVFKNNSNVTLWGEEVYNSLNNSADYFEPWHGLEVAGLPGYKADYCGPLGASSPVLYDTVAVNVTENGTLIFGPVPITIPSFTTINITQMSTNATKTCASLLNEMQWWRTNHTLTAQQLMIDKRLGDGRTTGRISAMNEVYSALRNYIISNQPELFNPTFVSPLGTLPRSDPVASRIDYLQTLYVTGPVYSTQPAPAFLNITRRTIYSLNVTLLSIAERATSRINETMFQQKDMNESLAVPVPLTGRSYVRMTVKDVLDLFVAANATNTTLPLASNPLLGSITTNYNLVEWRGNTTAYMMCGLDFRGPQFKGTCVDMDITCVASTNDTIPYNCTYLANNLTVAGDMASPTYRNDCELPCDRQADCRAVCECFDTCSGTQMCMCEACQRLSYDASTDASFTDIRSVVASAGGSSSVIASLANAGSSGRRSLLQTAPPPDLSIQLTNVLQQVGQVKSQQDSIASQMATLQSTVDQANQLATTRANDNTLINLIAAGRQDIQTGQKAIESKLDIIIGKQNQSLALAQSASNALAAIQGLAQMQLAAQQALEQAVQNQLTAIKTAAYQNIITLTQALSLWKIARRQEALTSKAAILSNKPCNALPSTSNNFKLRTNDDDTFWTPRARNIGTTNRVIAGMLIHQHRTNETNCSDSKFNQIQQTCTGPTTIKPFGVDPTFKMGTTLYNPVLDDINGTLVVGWYNCSELNSPTYDVPFENATTNNEPYCAELYNQQELPYAFHYFPLKGKTDGFPIWIDINLGAAQAMRWLEYLQQGLYLDVNTRSMSAEVVTYNAPLRIFGYYYMNFFFSEGGSIDITHTLQTVRVELYNSSEDSVRLALEIILNIMIACMFLYMCYNIVWTHKEKGNALKWFTKGWNIVTFLSNSLLLSCMIIWWIFVNDYAEDFNMSLRYEVYGTLSPSANYLALTENGAGLQAGWASISDLNALVDMLNWYYFLNGINILLLILRVLKHMDFQPRLGVVTRSLWLAGPDLIHFAIVAGMVFVGYAMMAHLIFGNAIDAFKTFGDSVNTCFEILLGNIDVNTELRELGGLQSVAGALFFWSYELLVFMVLLNFLLAIIVDAFSEVKDKTEETISVHTELFQLFRDKWRSALSIFSSNHISDAKLGVLLKQWAGEDGDDEDKGANINASKLLTVLNEDLDEDDLKTVLMECLKDAPGVDEAEEKENEKKKNKLLARFLPSRKKVVATPAEVDVAAKYIVERFGMKVEEEEEDYDDGRGGETQADAQTAAMDKERNQLATALERLAEVQRDLAESQRSLMTGQKQLAEQQAKLVTLMTADGGHD